jgi:hypothetical protein
MEFRPSPAGSSHPPSLPTKPAAPDGPGGLREKITNRKAAAKYASAFLTIQADQEYITIIKKLARLPRVLICVSERDLVR